MLKNVSKSYARELEAAAGSLNQYVDRLLSTELLEMNEQQVSTELSQFEPFQNQSTEFGDKHREEFIR